MDGNRMILVELELPCDVLQGFLNHIDLKDGPPSRFQGLGDGVESPKPTSLVIATELLRFAHQHFQNGFKLVGWMGALFLDPDQILR